MNQPEAAGAADPTLGRAAPGGDQQERPLEHGPPIDGRPAVGGGALRSLRHRDFRIFWCGFGAGVLGFQVLRVGLGLLVYELTGSALYLALVFGGDSIPMLLLSPIGGVLSDRMNRKAVLMASRSCVALLAVAIAILTATDMIAVWHLLVFALLSGICYAIDVPARQAMIHSLVPAGDLVNAIALTSIIRQAARIVGPALGSVAVLTLGAEGTFAIMAVGQAGNVLLVALVRLPRDAPARTASAAANLKEGLRFVAAHEPVWTLMLVSAIPAMTAMAYQSLTPVFAQDVLGRGSAAIGVMLTAAGIGALAGAALMMAFARWFGGARAATIAAITFGLVVGAFALTQSYPLALLLLVAAGATGAVYSIGTGSIIQQRTPRELQGRVMGVYQTTWELQVIGALAVGALADVTSAPAALALAGLVGSALIGALLLLRPGMNDTPPV